MRKIFLTFDIDWASDEVLEYTIDFLEQEEVAATFFVTHETHLLERLRKNSLFELGLHPNFQKLLSGDTESAMEEIFEQCHSIVSEAKSIRSHSLVQSSPLLDLFYQKGIRYDVNMFIPYEAKIFLKPFRHFNGILRVPYYFEDDVHCLMVRRSEDKSWNVKKLLQFLGIKVFNFHPIHLYLNTENLSRYEASRMFHQDVFQLDRFRFKDNDEGAMSILRRLVRVAKDNGFSFSCIRDIEAGD